MLARLTREFGFKLGTYQHGLECYKVAREVKESAIGASLFTDWWAYKMEVQDAIPFAAAILHDQGVLVSFNSDSDELARRMNQEAAKAVKYSARDERGDDTISESEALKFVTINPAIQLGVADRVGSLEVGKDADIAVWSGPPLSTRTRCEMTFVDGRRLFERSWDLRQREWIARERARLIQKILRQEAREKGVAPGALGGAEQGKEPGHVPPRTVGGEPAERRSLLDAMRAQRADLIREKHLELLRRGLDPRFVRCGECDGYAGE